MSIVIAVVTVIGVDQGLSGEPRGMLSKNFILCFLVVQSHDLVVAEAGQDFSIVDGLVVELVNAAVVKDCIVEEVCLQHDQVNKGHLASRIIKVLEVAIDHNSLFSDKFNGVGGLVVL